MLTARTYLALQAWPAAERAFLLDPRFAVIGGSGDGQTALTETAALSPELIIVDGVLSGMDGQTLLKHLQQRIQPPRVVYLMRFSREKAPLTDEALPWPGTAEALLTAARQAVSHPLPCLAWAHESLRLTLAEALLDALAMPRTLKGFSATALAAALSASAPWLLADKRGLLYPVLAQRLHTTGPAAERAIRTAIEHTWLLGDLAAIQRLFGLAVDAERGKPTNAELLAQLAEHVRREGQKRLLAQTDGAAQ